MQYTTNYNLNKPEGTDIVNPLTIDNPNWDSIDSAMYANKQNSVQIAQVALQETTIAITRDKSKPATFRFIATMNYSTNMTITVDGTSVTATMPDGSALAANAFRIGSNVLCSLNGTSLTVYTNPAIDVNAVKTTILQAIFPIGAIYTNVSDSTNPATTFGFGTWERIQGQFILGASATYEAGSTGGEAVHALTEDENGAHRHGITVQGKLYNWSNGEQQVTSLATGGSASIPMVTGSAFTVNSSGKGTPHNNMPPYLAVYMWRRTA